MAAYRAEEMIGATIESVLAQTLADFELIIVDDGSPDGTGEVIESYARNEQRITLIRQENAGAPAARNVAIKRSRAPIVSFVDNDDLWLPGYLEAVAEAFAADPAVGLVHADAWSFRGPPPNRVYHLSTLQDFGRRIADGPPERVLPKLIATNFISASSVSALREAVLAVGGFSAVSSGSEDWDLWLRIVEAGHSLARAGEGPLVLLRDHPHSITKDPTLVARARLEVARRARGRAEAAGSEWSGAAAQLESRARRELGRVERPSALWRARNATRRRLSPIKHSATDGFLWTTPPAEVESAIPGFERL